MSDTTLKLSNRQTAIAQLLCAGLMDKEIAARLKISVGTVRMHIRILFFKCRARNRTEAAVVFVTKHKQRIPRPQLTK